MASTRENFGSRLGFVLAAAGAAVGLGNIWGFPTQAASNGGGAFLMVYLIMILVVAFPMLVVEMAIGRHGQANPVDSMKLLTVNPVGKTVGGLVGWIGLSVPSAVLAFYSIVGGWLICFLLGAIAELFGFVSAAEWFKGFSVERNLFGTITFYVLTILIVQGGVKQGIEKWSSRLMPALFILFGLLFIYIMMQSGAMEGLKHYLIPDFEKVWDRKLILAAMGQGFFSLTIGGCSMLIYGSYLSKKENLPKMAMNVTLVDTAVAFIAGLVVMPAMFVAMQKGVQIYAEDGSLLSSDTLVFTVLPLMFESLGLLGQIFAIIFFLLLTIAALTSSISMLECPVALVSERMDTGRSLTSWVLGGLIALFSVVIVFNFGDLFGLVAMVATQYLQPTAALMFCLFGGWVWNRHSKIKELEQGNPDFQLGWFGKIWPAYVKFVCPVLVATVIWASFG
ncbi:putative Na+-dependent transporter of the SNF family [Vibrio nigripulchritudo SFn27]|uniref:Putative Na+-dependent transporter of the SNF family n=1 Tax=Vibrio nigripulchritudo TaxID=28173 RepID=U4JVA7_9VIBR|nr:sodium-dependent transporter [Vibrio nigripulchritudo]CCN81912.1 putative Na+-dependent transporter of the SNF family [Vibrio nigripulchritudo BLFn1]CCN88377.1 putative Na+-dependent transporter of the SNF family [Vibrio nigripulchritudo SFn27]CCN95368.1 putative Na+-dependent transporter of the SNF family [Vibrio nigripulchritudo ENn2]CCO41364.1 putative Na+-dependent transporter of the SNF family [Vibrio nigripulchritudo SFn135]CCO54065.1 putative Na+-dependent transporter of the SNF fami